MASTDSIPVPKKNTAFRLYFTVRDSSGVPVTGFTSPDSEVSKDGGAFADCTNEATYVGHGMGYIDLTSTEMNADAVCYYMSCSEGNIDVAIAPEELGDIRVNMTQCNGTNQTARDLGGQLDAAITTRLAPTTAGRTLDVSAGGEAGIDWANVGSPTTTVSLSGTTVATVTTTTTATNLTNAPTAGDFTATMKSSITAAVPTAGNVATSVWTFASASLGSQSTVGGWFNSLLQGIRDSIGSFSQTGENNIFGFLMALLSKGAATPSDVGGTFDPATDSVEAIREKADTLSTLAAADVRTAVGLASANLDTQLSNISTKQGTPAGASLAVDIAAVKSDTAATLSRTDVATSTRLASSGNAGTGGVLLGDEEDVYPADIQCTIDDASDRDEYTVQWFRNGAPVVSGVTSPLIQVVKRADGSDLIASTAMTQIGSTGAYKYDTATEGERNTAGEAVIVQASATINGSTRTWRKLITRDSAAS